jgi:CubicO group peptidase (beta-lactamase class C family)
MPLLQSVRRLVLAALLLAAAAPALPGQPGAQSAAARLGFDAARLARLDTLFDRAVNDGRIAGAVALVLRDGKTVYERATGWADKEAGRRMTPDAIFRIASQSKAITSVAVLQLVEQGKLELSDPVSKWIPAFAKTTVAVRDTAAGEGRVRIVPARRAITIRDLLTHTAGISYGTDPQVATLYQERGLGPAAGWGWYTADKDEPICATMERLPGLPFVSQPGDAFVYGYNTDVLGCVVERASGMPLDRYVRSRITGPLGMRDTDFYLPPDKAARLAAVYASGDDGRVTRAPDGARGQGNYVSGPRTSFSGGAGLLSTARDYAHFLEALRLGGAIDGVRILAPHTVALMTTDQLGTVFSRDGSRGFGLGFEIIERYGSNGMASVGTFSWGGAYATTYSVDPVEGLVLVLMFQNLPNRSDVGGKFPTLVYQALVESRARR